MRCLFIRTPTPSTIGSSSADADSRRSNAIGAAPGRAESLEARQVLAIARRRVAPVALGSSSADTAVNALPLGGHLPRSQLSTGRARGDRPPRPRWWRELVDEVNPVVRVGTDQVAGPDPAAVDEIPSPTPQVDSSSPRRRSVRGRRFRAVRLRAAGPNSPPVPRAATSVKKRGRPADKGCSEAPARSAMQIPGPVRRPPTTISTHLLHAAPSILVIRRPTVEVSKDPSPDQIPWATRELRGGPRLARNRFVNSQR